MDDETCCRILALAGGGAKSFYTLGVLNRFEALLGKGPLCERFDLICCFEYSIREWAANPGDTFVVVGTTRGELAISSPQDPNEVEINVPSHYFSMVYRAKPKASAIGVMVPNEEGHLDVRKHMMSVSDLEKRT